jgi:hypothetical protein
MCYRCLFVTPRPWTVISRNRPGWPCTDRVIDQTPELKGNRKLAVERLRDFIVTSVDAAHADDAPFYHLVLDRVFPDDIYAGASRRTNASLTLAARFGPGYRDVDMYPIPVLTRDIPGYLITPHTDTHWKGITVQLYLPRDRSTAHVGTIFHEKLADGSMPKKKQMTFAPNSGYAFAVGTDTWHSAHAVGPEVRTRDSILLTYFVDAGVLRYLRNRGKRFGNFVLNEIRNRLP